MSLRVWLPLTKDLRNQGLSNVTVTNNGATYSSTGGKLGGCYTFDGNDYIHISMPSEMTTLKGISVAAWVKSTSSTLALGGISNNVNYTVPMCTLYTSGWQFGNDAQNGYRYVSGGTIANTNTWHHVCCTVSDTTIVTYLDGMQVASGAISGVTTFTNANFIEIGCDHPGGDEYLTGSVNDFRIYDHVLSPLEVKQISQGLVLHYPLNRNGWGQENLLKNSNDLTLWNKESGVNCEYDLTVKMYKVFSTTRESSRWGIYQDYSVSVDVDTEYTFSLTGKTDGFRSYLSFGAGSGWPTNYTAFDNNKQRLSKTLTIPAGTTNIRVYLAMYPTTGGGYAYFEKPKLEIGNKATPWCPNSSDTLATTMGLNDNVEYDTSGYGNNGTKAGMFSWTSDTPRYNVSTEFNTNNYIIIDSLIIDMNNVSFAIWVKWDAFNSYSRIWDFGQVASGGGYCCFLMNDVTNGSIKLRLRNASGTELLNYNLITANINTWYHIAFTLSNTTCKIYINGVLKDTRTLSSNIGTAIFNYPYIGKSNWSTDALLDGKLSDFRIYATALSAEDVKSLYQNSAYIDSQGNIYGAVYEEV